MSGGGASTGGIGAQSPAVNPPNPMGQIGNAVGGALGGMGGQPQNPMGGGNFIQTGQFGSKPVDMGGFADFGDFERGQQNPNMTYGQPFMGQPFMGQPFMGGESPTPSFGLPPRDLGFNSVQPGMGGEGFDQRQLTPDMMANMQQAAQAARQAPQQPFVFQDDQQRASLAAQPQTAGLGGLAALLGGKPTPPTPAVSAPPPAAPVAAKPAPVAAKPAPVAAKRAPVAAKPVAKPSAVPPKTPPAVASAIQKLAAKKKPFGRR